MIPKKMAVVATPTAKFARFTTVSKNGMVRSMSIKSSHPRSRMPRILAPTRSWKSMRGIWEMGLLTQQAAMAKGMFPRPMKQQTAARSIWKGMGSMAQKRPMDMPMETLRTQGRQRSRLKNLMTTLFSQLTLRMRRCLSARYDLRTSLE